MQPWKVTTIKLSKAVRDILANANHRDSIYRELMHSPDPITIPSTLPANVGELLAWAGADLGGAAYVYACWAAVIRYVQGVAPSPEAAHPVIVALSSARRKALRDSAWPAMAATGPDPEESPLVRCAWFLWHAADSPHMDAAASDTARALWYAAGKPLRRILSSAYDQLRAARKAKLH